MTVSRKLTIGEIAEELNIAYGSAQDILFNDLGFRRVAAQLVPKDLNCMQKRDRVDVAKDMLSKVDSDPSFIKRIITGDETWIYEYDTHSRRQANEWRSPNAQWFKMRKKRSKFDFFFFFQLFLTVCIYLLIFIDFKKAVKRV